MYTVYMHEHRLNGKKYIGITSQDVHKRWANGKGYKPTSHFRCAIDKYGWDMFRHEILYTDLTYEDACRVESEMIAKYQTNNREFGYNNSVGGERGALGNHHELGEETRAKMSASKRGVARPKWKDDRKPAEGSLKALQSTSEQRRRAVVCVETGEVYPSIREASRATGINISNLCQVCKSDSPNKYAGKLPDGTKLHWRYKDN